MVFSSEALKTLKAQADIDRQYKVLVVDDETANQRVMVNALCRDYQVIAADCGELALDEIAKNPEICVVITDQRMPGMSGVELLQACRRQLPNAVGIIVTGYVDIEVVVNAINEAQIFKFIIKPVDRSDLLLTVTRAIESFEARRAIENHARDLEARIEERTRELKEALALVKEASLTDALTGLRNRRFMTENLAQEQALLIRKFTAVTKEGELDVEQGHMAFFLIDLDGFKTINDSFGHATGDRVLVEVAKALREVTRDSDYLARWGGDEFLMVARDTVPAQAPLVAQRLSDAVAGLEVQSDEGKAIPMHCSVGFAVFPIQVSHPGRFDWTEVLALADRCLFAAKRSGRTAWVGLNATSAAQTQPKPINGIDDPKGLINSGLATLHCSDAIKDRVDWG